MNTETTDPTRGEGQELFGARPVAAVRVDKAAAAGAGSEATARVILPNRSQIELRPMDLESLLPEGHRARLVWAWVERQDLSAMYAAIKVRQGGVGCSAIAPQILLGLWLYALLQGVGSARQLARLVLEHDAYRWMSGGVQVNHHSLSDFRVAHGQALDELLSASLAALMTAGAVRLECVAQDGMRVRASAGAASFRRKASLQDNLELARKRVRELKEQIDADPAQDSRRKAAAQQRARREMQQRLQSALDRLPELEAIKRRNGSKAEEARASSTDADATVMKLADGGYRPAYNIQYAADCDSQLIVGVEVSTSGSDMAQLAPMVGQIEQRLGSAPPKMLVDGGYPAHAQIDAVADKTEVYAPVPEARVKGVEGRQVGCRLVGLALLEQVARVDLVPLAHDAGPLDAVVQLPDTALPRMAQQRGAGAGGEQPHGLATIARLVDQEALGQPKDVLRPLAKRRHLQVNHVDAVVQILAEASLLHEVLEVLVRCADDAEVHGQRDFRPQPLHLAVLEHAQESNLHRRRELGDLVEEERAALGLLDVAAPLSVGAGERTSLVPEEGGLDQGLGTAPQLSGRRSVEQQVQGQLTNLVTGQRLIGAGRGLDLPQELQTACIGIGLNQHEQALPVLPAEAGRVQPRLHEQCCHRGANLLESPLERPEGLARQRIGVAMPRRGVDGVEHAAQRVVDLVGDGRRHPPHGGQPVGGHDLPLQGRLPGQAVQHVPGLGRQLPHLVTALRGKQPLDGFGRFVTDS